MVSKTYADGVGPTYAYYDNGKLKTRIWARGVTTTYSYDDATGALVEVDYSDGTPSVVYSNFDRLGRPRQVRDGSGARTLAYTRGMTTYEKYVEGPLAGFAINRNLDANDQLSELSVTQDGATVYDVGYQWAGIGRLGSVTWVPVGASLATAQGNDTVTYGYTPDSNLVASVAFAHDGNTTLTTTKTFDNLNRLTEIDNVPANDTPMNVAYEYYGRDERTKATREDGTYWQYGYDDLGQVDSGGKFLANGTPIPGLQYGYDYDSIGNRKDTKTNGRVANYQTNLLNQYTSRDVPRALDVLGTANANANVTVNGQPATRTGQYWYEQLDFSGNNSTQWVSVDIRGLLDALSANQSGFLFLPAHPENFAYDADGNLLSDGRWLYTWDGENRLIGVRTNDAAAKFGAPKVRIAYAYDAQNRRISKTVNAWNISSNSWLPDSSSLLFLYDGWNLLTEIGAVSANTVVAKSYIWGLDMSGSLQGAGGVGGLLMADLGTQRNYYSVDGNGNVIGLTDAATGKSVAQYEYDPFGKIVASSGTLVGQNPFGFSTKYQNDDTDQIYYGHRLFSPIVGRWLSRDPMCEIGGVNLYNSMHNNTVDLIDVTGEWATDVHHQIVIDWLGNGYKSYQWYDTCLNIVKDIDDGSDLVDGVDSNGSPTSGWADAQSSANSYQHAMSSWTENVTQATNDYNDFVNYNLDIASNYASSAMVSGNSSLMNNALVHLGKAYHSISDSTSPAHTGFQTWYGPVDGVAILGAVGYAAFVSNHESRETMSVYQSMKTSVINTINSALGGQLYDMLMEE